MTESFINDDNIEDDKNILTANRLLNERDTAENLSRLFERDSLRYGRDFYTGGEN